MYLSKVFRRYSMAAMSVLSYPYPPRRGRIRYIHVNYLGKRKREGGERERQEDRRGDGSEGRKE